MEALDLIQLVKNRMTGAVLLSKIKSALSSLRETTVYTQQVVWDVSRCAAAIRNFPHPMGFIGHVAITQRHGLPHLLKTVFTGPSTLIDAEPKIAARMPQYKLTYFNFRGLGEPIRYLLAYLEEEYEEKQITFPEWRSFKSTTPFGKVPVLEVDGKPLCQSVAISRWLGKKANLAGNNDWEALQIDIVIDTLTDMRNAVGESWFEMNPEIKASKLEVLVKDTIPGYLSKFDKLVEDNGGYLANGSLSWGDLFFASVIETYLYMIGGKVPLDEYPNLKALKEKVDDIPQIKSWLAERPELTLVINPYTR